MPREFRYTEDKPYISNGAGRNTVKDKAYVGVEADVAEFEDMYFHSPFNGGTVNKMGLGIDEFCDACIQFSRKNYADLMPDGSIKLVGNSIKSKKMPIYIEKFLNDGIRLLLEGRGKDFLELYYDYIEKIYNMRIPLKDIASVGKIKTTIRAYKESCKQTTKSGSKKARQAWYELAIKHGLNPDMGTSIYYINTGKKKSSSDVQRLTHYYEYRDGVKTEITKELEKEYKQMQKDNEARNKFNMLQITKAQWWRRNHPDMIEEDELVFNCVMLDNNIVEDEEDHFCDDNFEYNVDKYIDMFNKRIKPLLVCFSKDVREKYNEKGKLVSNILITNPKDRKIFTEEESRLTSGEPYDKNDQDTYEALMTMEDKEIKFWLSVDREPPFVKECGMDWEELKNDYIERMRVFENEANKKALEAYRAAIENLKPSDVETFISEGKLPAAVAKIAEEDVNSTNLISKTTGIVLGTIMDIIDFNGGEDDLLTTFDN